MRRCDRRRLRDSFARRRWHRRGGGGACTRRADLVGEAVFALRELFEVVDGGLADVGQRLLVRKAECGVTSTLGRNISRWNCTYTHTEY